MMRHDTVMIYQMSILIKCQLVIKLNDDSQKILDALNGMRVHYPGSNQVLASSASVIPRAKIIVCCPPSASFELVAPMREVLDLEYQH